MDWDWEDRPPRDTPSPRRAPDEPGQAPDRPGQVPDRPEESADESATQVIPPGASAQSPPDEFASQSIPREYVLPDRPGMQPSAGPDAAEAERPLARTREAAERAAIADPGREDYDAPRPRSSQDRAARRERRRRQLRRRRLVALAVVVAIVVLLVVLIVRGCGGSDAAAAVVLIVPGRLSACAERKCGG